MQMSSSFLRKGREDGTLIDAIVPGGFANMIKMFTFGNEALAVRVRRFSLYERSHLTREIGDVCTGNMSVANDVDGAKNTVVALAEFFLRLIPGIFFISGALWSYTI